jgi:O-antigen ligase
MRVSQAVITVSAVYYLLQNSPLTDVRGLWSGTITAGVGAGSEIRDRLIYVAAVCLLAGLMASANWVAWRSPAPTTREVRGVIAAVSVLCLRYLLDALVSDASRSSLRERWWIYPILTCFFLVFLVGRLQQRYLAILEFVVVCAGAQAGYAAYAYFSGNPQCWDPHFGKRAMGTFENPNFLAPVCLLSVGLAIGLQQAAQPGRDRLLFTGLGLVNAIALILTFTRSAWLGLASLLTWLACCRWASRSRGARTEVGRRGLAVRGIALLFAVSLIVSAALVRTHGRVIGNPLDTSSQKRLAIWKIAWTIFLEKPLWGHGFATYTNLQYQPRHMAARPREIRLINTAPENLWLNTACEFGLCGWVTWGWLVAAYVRLHRYGVRHLAAGSAERKLLVAVSASLMGLMVVGLFDTPVMTMGRGRDAATWLACVCLAVGCCVVHGTASPRAPASAGVKKHRATAAAPV